MESLQYLTTRLLDETSSPLELDRCCLGLHEWFINATETVSLDDPMQLPAGLALAPASAAQCILDTKRTVAFIRGLSLALDEARRRFIAGGLEVVYAGAGPFAPLVLPLMSVRAFRDVRFTFLDCHRQATETVQGLITRLGLENRVRRVVTTDATSYTHPEPIHVVVTETLQRSLAKEPFVSIVSNLRRQLAPGGILLPERVAVNVALIDAAEEQTRWSGVAPRTRHRSLARIFEVTMEGEFPSLDRDGRSKPVTVVVPRGTDDLRLWLALITRVDVFGNIGLAEYDSGLTFPEVIWELLPVRDAEVLEFQFVMDSTPGVRCKRVQPAKSLF